jgi:hypothetical protein
MTVAEIVAIEVAAVKVVAVEVVPIKVPVIAAVVAFADVGVPIFLNRLNNTCRLIGPGVLMRTGGEGAGRTEQNCSNSQKCADSHKTLLWLSRISFRLAENSFSVSMPHEFFSTLAT